MRTVLALVLLAGCTGDGSGDDSNPVDDSGDDSGATEGVDKDGDGFGDLVDCDDTRKSVNPGVAADVCNEVDDDCDGAIDEDPDLSWYPDDDGDGFGKAGNGSAGCARFEGYVPNGDDCDDGNVARFPGAEDLCDGVDNDCDDQVDEDPTSWVPFNADADGDGAGDPDGFVYGCSASAAGGVDNDWDCNDGDETIPVWVSTAGSSRGAGTLASPLRDIQPAIESGKDCVVVMEGAYDEEIDFGGRNISVRGVDGSGRTTIRGVGSGPVVSFRSGETDAVLEGFTLTGGAGVYGYSSYNYWDGTQYVYYDYYSWFGGGVYVSNSWPTLRDVVIEDNVLPDYYYAQTSSNTWVYRESQGGGIYLAGGGVALEDVRISDNRAAYGGAIMANGFDTIEGKRVEISANSGQYNSIYQSGGTIDLDGFVINAELTDYGSGGLFAWYGNVRLQNGVLVSSDYGLYNYASVVEMSSVVVGSSTYGLYDADTSQSDWTLTYNDVYGNRYDYYGVSSMTGVAGNVSSSPSFVYWTDDTLRDDDFTLSSTSRLRDAGPEDEARYDRDGSRNDIGAYGGPNGFE